MKEINMKIKRKVHIMKIYFLRKEKTYKFWKKFSLVKMSTYLSSDVM